MKRRDLDGQGEVTAGDSLLDTIRNQESFSYGLETSNRNQLSSRRRIKNASMGQPSYLKPSGRAPMRLKAKNPFLSSVDAATKVKVPPFLESSSGPATKLLQRLEYHKKFRE